MASLQQVVNTVTSPAVVQNVGWLLVHSLWQCVLAAFLAAVLSRAMRRSSSAMRYGMLTGSLSLMVVAPVATMLAFPQWDVVIAANDQRVELSPVESVKDVRQFEGDKGHALQTAPTPAETSVASSEIKKAGPTSEPGMISWAASVSSRMKAALRP